MTEPSPGTPESRGTLNAIEHSLADAHKKLSKLYDIQRASRVQLMLLIAALIAVMLIFGTQIYWRVTENFNRSLVQQQLTERLPILGQDVAQKINPVLHEVAPVYAKQMKDRLIEIAPTLRDDADVLLKELPRQIHDDVISQINASVTRVAQSIQKQTQKQFPYLSDDRAHGIMQHLTDALDRESKAVTAKADVLFTNELHKVYSILEKIDVPPVDKKRQEQVERELIHHLLMYVDSQLMAESTSE
ncbi:MAG: hypothetical protein ACF8OB_14880 [Phycisphaeraceae bacterium JB051]